MSIIHVYQTPQAIHLTHGVGSPNQNFPVNRCDFRLVDGVRNEVEVFVKDLDRKPVSITGSPVMRILDRAREQVLLETQLATVDAAKGRYRLVVEPGDKLPIGIHTYAVLLEVPGQAPTALFTDRDRGVSSSVEVVVGPMAYPPAATVLLPEDMLTRDEKLYSTPLPGAALVDHRVGIHTALAHLVGFTGAITVEGSLEAQPPSEDSAWFALTREVFQQASGPHPLTVEGMLIWCRIVIETVAGEVEKVTYRN